MSKSQLEVELLKNITDDLKFQESENYNISKRVLSIKLKQSVES